MEKIKTVAAVLLLGVIFMAVQRITYELVFLLLLLLLLPSCETWNELVYGHKHATGSGAYNPGAESIHRHMREAEGARSQRMHFDAQMRKIYDP